MKQAAPRLCPLGALVQLGQGWQPIANSDVSNISCAFDVPGQVGTSLSVEAALQCFSASGKGGEEGKEVAAGKEVGRAG